MAPFAIVAPILGPAIDRSRGGRRMLVILSAAGRAVLCLVMAQYISKAAPEGLLVYPLAFGVLVLAEGAVDREELARPCAREGQERARQRQLALRAAQRDRGDGRRAAPRLGIQHLFGADWSLRVAAVVFVIASILAFQIPKASARGPTDQVDDDKVAEELHQPSILLAGSAMAVLRGSVGFLAFFTAFSLKDDLFGLGVALAAGAIGGFVGVVLAPIARKSAREEVILASALVVPATLTLFGAIVGGTLGFLFAAFSVAIGAAAGRLGFDSLLQRDGPDAVRGRAFARFETRFQLVWVIGGILGVIPFAGKLGLFLLAVLLACGAASYVAALRDRAAPHDAHPAASGFRRSRDRALAQPGVRPGAPAVQEAGEGELTPAPG